jgi:hypothetical protein
VCGHLFQSRVVGTPAIPEGCIVGVDTAAVLALVGGYIAAAIAVFLLYSPVIVLVLALLLAAGMLQLLAWPFIVLFRKLRRKPEPPNDGSWLLH